MLYYDIHCVYMLLFLESMMQRMQRAVLPIKTNIILELNNNNILLIMIGILPVSDYDINELE